MTDPDTKSALRHGPLTADMVPLLKAGSSVLRHKPTGWVETYIRTEGPDLVFTRPLGYEHCALLSNCTYIGERGPDGWITAPDGGWTENPVPGMRIEAKYQDGQESHWPFTSDEISGWFHPDGGLKRIIAFRPAEGLTAHPPATGSGEADTATFQLICDMAAPATAATALETLRSVVGMARARLDARIDARLAAPIAGRGDREAVARIIDPDAFAAPEAPLLGIQYQRACVRKDAALAKADAILALSAPASVAGVE